MLREQSSINQSINVERGPIFFSQLQIIYDACETSDIVYGQIAKLYRVTDRVNTKYGLQYIRLIAIMFLTSRYDTLSMICDTLFR